MDEYLEKNSRYWAGKYAAPNVESFIFRFYGRILKFDYGIDGSMHERILDFGCGCGRVRMGAWGCRSMLSQGSLPMEQ